MFQYQNFKTSYQCTWLTLAIASLLAIANFSSGQDVAELGFAASKPAEGNAVKIAKGFLVNYSQAIPGSSVKFEMLPIPAGKVNIGSPKSESDRNADEGPVFQVEVQPFWMGKYEVTWAEYQEFMKLCDIFEKFNDLKIRQVTKDNEVDAITAPSKLYDPSFTYQSGEELNLPAVSMSQFAAKQYTKWLSLLTGQFYRLPTEAEWEYACRGGTTTAYSFGDDLSQLDDYVWHTDNSDWESHPVGQKKPNPWGLYDMHGNVAEWVLDEYDAQHYVSFADKLVPVAKTIRWPTVLFPRVLRGGSWDHEIKDCRSASRIQSDDDEWRSYDPNSPQSPWWFASDESQVVGFRIVRPLVAPPKSEWKKYWDADLDEISRVATQRIEQEGRGEQGLVDPDLPQAIKQLQD